MQTGQHHAFLEKALSSLNIPVAFYRLGNIGPHRSGAYNRNDAQMLLIEACERLNTGLDTDTHTLEFSPLEDIVNIILNQDKPEVVNVVNIKRLPLKSLKFHQMLPLELWMERATEDHPILVKMLSEVDHWLEDSNQYECRFGPFDYETRMEALLTFMRCDRAQ